jgi:hypothetical protein
LEIVHSVSIYLFRICYPSDTALGT